MIEYCTCKLPPGYASLRDELNTFVCGACGKPSYLTWLASHQYCSECGISFYSLWESLCPSCCKAILALSNEGEAWAVEMALALNLGSPVRTGDISAGQDGCRIWRSWEQVFAKLQEEPYRAYGP